MNMMISYQELVRTFPRYPFAHSFVIDTLHSAEVPLKGMQQKSCSMISKALYPSEENRISNRIYIANVEAINWNWKCFDEIVSGKAGCYVAARARNV